MDVFEFRDHLIKEFSSYIKSFILIKDEKINKKIDNCLNDGILWPDPLIQINPFFESGSSIENLVNEGLLHPECNSVIKLQRVRISATLSGKGDYDERLTNQYSQ